MSATPRTTLQIFALCAAGCLTTLSGADPSPITKPVAATKPATLPAASQSVPPPLSAGLKAKIDAAVAKLSSDDWKQRQAGQDELARLAEPAMPTLQRLANKSDDEEVRTRAAAALRQIEETAQVGGSIITLNVTNAKPQELFELLGKQARYDFPTQPRNLWKTGHNGASISLKLEGVDFWTAFKDICQKTGLYPQQYGQNQRMTLQQGSNPSWNGPSVVSGPFLIVANRIQRTNSVELANADNVQRDCNLTLTAFAEPKVRVIQSSYNVRVDQAEDENGNSLIADAARSYGMSSGQQWMWNLQARLSYPEKNPGQKIKILKGSIKFLVQLQSELIEIDDVLTAKSVEKRLGGRRMLFKQAKKQNENQYEVQVTVFRDGLGQAEWNAMQGNASGIKLVDKEGRALTSQGWGSSSDGSKMDYNWNFSQQNFGGDEGKPGEPHRLIWEVPTETRELEVPFVFKDLRLP